MERYYRIMPGALCFYVLEPALSRLESEGSGHSLEVWTRDASGQPWAVIELSIKRPSRMMTKGAETWNGFEDAPSESPRIGNSVKILNRDTMCAARKKVKRSEDYARAKIGAEEVRDKGSR